jgi:hypothetical protein
MAELTERFLAQPGHLASLMALNQFPNKAKKRMERGNDNGVSEMNSKSIRARRDIASREVRRAVIISEAEMILHRPLQRSRACPFLSIVRGYTR